MIFVTLGSQKFQFNRLLKEIDTLIEENNITEEVFAQIGYSDYQPRNYKYKDFLDRDEFNKLMSTCDKVITHGGTGAIVGAIKKEKKVIAVPRLAKYGEHVDDHQLEIVSMLSDKNYILYVRNIKGLLKAVQKINDVSLNIYVSNTESIISEVESFIESI